MPPSAPPAPPESIPVADDRDGRVLSAALDPSTVTASTPSSVPTYSMGDHETTDLELDEGVTDLLRALGYTE